MYPHASEEKKKTRKRKTRGTKRYLGNAIRPGPHEELTCVTRIGDMRIGSNWLTMKDTIEMMK